MCGGSADGSSMTIRRHENVYVRDVVFIVGTQKSMSQIHPVAPVVLLVTSEPSAGWVVDSNLCKVTRQVI